MILIRKILAAMLALLQTFFINIGLLKPDALLTTVDPLRKDIVPVSMADSASNRFADTIAYAQSTKNVVQCTYTDSHRNAYTMRNSEIALTHDLTGVEKNATLQTIDGDVYLQDTFRSFYVDAFGIRHYFESSFGQGRVNTIRLGAYYYDCHVRDLMVGNYMVDKGFHVYADKLYMEYAILAKMPTKTLDGFGSEIRIPEREVQDVKVESTGGRTSYVAFDLRNVGIVGFIVPDDGTTEKVVVSQKNGCYILTQYAAFDHKAGLNKYDETGSFGLNKISFGCRIYTDRTHNFDGIAREAFIEHNPLSVRVTDTSGNASFLGYNALRGTYDIQIDATDFGYAYQNPDRHFNAELQIDGDASDRTIFVRTTGGNSGCLEAAAVLDENKTLLPLDVEVCKNFMGDGGEPYYGFIDYAYSDAFFPVCMKAGESKTLTVVNAYQNWGRYPLKQISSIEFHTSYYHLSTGTTESNCIAPYFVFGRDGWTLPDFRNRSGKMWDTQPQFNSVGVLDFVRYHDARVKNPVVAEFRGSTVHSRGMSYSDVTNYYVSDSGKFTYDLRHVEFPQVDENRTYYTVNIRFTDNVTFRDFQKDFDLFYFDGRSVKFDKTDYLNKSNEPVLADVTAGTTYHKLGNNHPYFGFFKISEDTANQIDNGFGCNFALMVKDCNIIMGGQKADIPFLFREMTDKSMTAGALTLDAKSLSFQKGDSIEMNILLLPWGTGREETDENVLTVRADSCENPVTVRSTAGTVTPENWIPVVRADNNNAQFTVSGGRNNIAVRVDGFTGMAKPDIFTLENGEWVPYETASVNGYDGYTVHANDDGTYSFSFVYTAKEQDITFLVRQP